MDHIPASSGTKAEIPANASGHLRGKAGGSVWLGSSVGRSARFDPKQWPVLAREPLVLPHLGKEKIHSLAQLLDNYLQSSQARKPGVRTWAAVEPIQQPHIAKAKPSALFNS